MNQPIADRTERLTAALRQCAIVPKQKRGVQNRVEYDGFRCRICGCAWLTANPENHSEDCILEGTHVDARKP